MPKSNADEFARPATSFARLVSGRCRSGYRTRPRPGSRPKPPGRRGFWRSGRQVPQATRRWLSGMRSAARRGMTSLSASMRRGDLVTVALRGDAGKPRPALVIQADHFAELSTVVVVPLTSTLLDLPLVRVTIRVRIGNRIAAALTGDDLAAAIRATQQTRPGHWLGRCRDTARSDAPAGRPVGDRVRDDQPRRCLCRRTSIRRLVCLRFRTRPPQQPRSHTSRRKRRLVSRPLPRRITPAVNGQSRTGFLQQVSSGQPAIRCRCPDAPRFPLPGSCIPPRCHPGRSRTTASCSAAATPARRYLMPCCSRLAFMSVSPSQAKAMWSSRPVLAGSLGASGIGCSPAGGRSDAPWARRRSTASSRGSPTAAGRRPTAPRYAV